jgi:hypothetical protein
MSITSGNKRVQALAVDFEAAWKEERDCGNEEIDAACDRTQVFVNRILRLRGTDISILRLKARAFLWADARYPEKFADYAHYTTEKALASLFRDLGAYYPVGAAAIETKVAA